MKKIMIVDPDGTIDVNPNLIGIVDILCERGYGVDYYCNHSNEFKHVSWHPSLRFVFLNTRQIIDRYALVIGVDYSGIIMAARFATKINVPYGLISYEIFFSSEIGSLNKKDERAACEGISFAVCQDRVRSSHLSRENRIPLENIIDIPVAPRGVGERRHSTDLHQALGLPLSTRIAMSIGGLQWAWTMVDEIVESTRMWSDDWVLVLNYSHDPGKFSDLQARHPGADKVFLSPRSGAPYADLPQVLACADLGVALYKPIFDSNQFDGLNMQHIGMGSGKIATFLQHGVPVLVNEIGEMSDHVVKEGLGICVRDPEEIPARLHELDPESLDTMSAAATRFFATTLDLDVRVAPLTAAIEKLIGR
jgi:hypothetical protein